MRFLAFCDLVLSLCLHLFACMLYPGGWGGESYYIVLEIPPVFFLECVKKEFKIFEAVLVAN